MCGYFITVAHNCHGKLKFTAANSNSPRQIQIPPHTTSVQYCGGFQYIGGCSVHRGDNISTMGNSFNSVEIAQYSGG